MKLITCILALPILKLKYIVLTIVCCILLLCSCKKSNEEIDKTEDEPTDVIEPVNSLVNISANLPATDSLGRKLPTHDEVGDLRKDKFVGLFYWTWHTNFAGNSALNTTEILASNPEAINDFNSPVWKNNRGPYFWNEPLFGYYRDTDHWLLRKHAEMLADAGIDVIFFDCTNGSYTWKESYMELCKVFTEAREDGVKTPQIAFMLAFGPTDGSRTAIKELYNDMYSVGLYQDLWFYWKGKPLIMAYPEMLSNVPDNPAKTNSKIAAFFTFRPGQPAYNIGPQRSDNWGWLEIYPQHEFKKRDNGGFEQVTVGVAQNWSKERGLTAMNAPNSFGRSYTDKGGEITTPDAEKYGYNFQEQWDRALQLDPEFIFITGWNEWIAGQYELWQEQPNAFPDEFSTEKSRDIEPMKGGHGDNYYFQMISNIRHFKGMPADPKVSGEKDILIDGNFEDWADVSPDFRAHKGSTIHRNSQGWGSLYYTNNTGRNDFVLAKVARNDQTLFFYIETAATITSQTDPGWMRLLIDTDCDKKTGWEGYDYIINRVSPDKKAILEKNMGGWKWEKAGDIEFTKTGNKMELSIPRNTIGITGKINIEFKWSDNMQEEGNIMDFYLNGDVAPAGRFNYNFSEI